MNATTTATASTIHPFEKAGLGKAPFRYLGVIDQNIDERGEAVIGSIGGVAMTTHAGGTCDYCGHAIIDMFRVRSADGRTFKVGCDCIDKVSGVLETNRMAADRKALKLARDGGRIDRARAALTSAHLLRSRPHPIAYRAAQGATMADYCEWMFRHAGRTGQLAAARIVEKAHATATTD